MRTLTADMWKNSAVMIGMAHRNLARPVGPVSDYDPLIWVRSKTDGTVIRIGLVLKEDVKIV